MKHGLGVLFLGVGLASSVFGLESRLQEWRAPGLLAKILLSQRAQFPELHAPRLSADAIDEKASQCVFQVERPGLSDPALRSAKNQLVCSLQSLSGERAELRMDLSAVPIQGWGNRAEELQMKETGGPGHFQILNNEINERLYQALKAAYPNPVVEELHVCLQGLCVTEYSLMADTGERYRPAHLSCVMDTENDKVYQTRCIFMNP